MNGWSTWGMLFWALWSPESSTWTTLNMSEGDLTEARASIVRGDSLSRCALDLGLGEHLLLGQGEEQTGGRTKPNNLACALEAVAGALYLDQGPEAAGEFVLRVLRPYLDAVVDRQVTQDPKSQLQETAQARGLASPNIERSLNGDRGTTANSRSRLPSRERPLHRAAGGARWTLSDRQPQRPSPFSPLRRPDERMNRRRRRNRTHRGSERRDSRPVWPWVFLAAVVAVILALARTVL